MHTLFKKVFGKIWNFPFCNYYLLSFSPVAASHYSNAYRLRCTK